MRIVETPLPGVLLLEPTVHRDARGFFRETFNSRTFAAAALPDRFAQHNHSHSRRGVVRGLHYQLRCPQGKLLSVTRGEIYDVSVDIRRGSPTFGQWFGVRLHADDLRQLWIPPGFAHGFSVLSDVADVFYSCTGAYEPGDEHGVLWSDPGLGIDWRVAEPLLSAKDLGYAPLDAARADLPAYDP